MKFLKKISIFNLLLISKSKTGIDVYMPKDFFKKATEKDKKLLNFANSYSIMVNMI